VISNRGDIGAQNFNFTYLNSGKILRHELSVFGQKIFWPRKSSILARILEVGKGIFLPAVTVPLIACEFVDCNEY